MSDFKQTKSLSCTCTTSLPQKRRRKRRNYSYYRDYTVIDLQSVLQKSRTSRPDLLERLFPEPKAQPIDKPNQTVDSEDCKNEQSDIFDESDVAMTMNCPFRTPDDALVPIHGAFYFHVRSKINLGQEFLKKEEAKTILEEQFLHYSRACRVSLINYSIQNDHFHILIAVQTNDYRTAREKASKMTGCIKQQFTKRFKLWYNEHYVRERRHRIKRLPKGTLWDARAEIEFIANEAELMASVLYIESNYLKIQAATEIRALKTPPVEANCFSNSDEFVNSSYQILERYLAAHKFQSCGWYANGRKQHTTALSDGNDGNWLTGKELEYWWNKPVKSYPAGLRKVWFQKGGGILAVTPDHRRQYHKNPILDLLDKKPSKSGRILRHLVFATCWDKRAHIWVSDSNSAQEPGSNEF